MGILSLVTFSSLAEINFLCVNKTGLKNKFSVFLYRDGALLKGPTKSCNTTFIPYNPNSPKYEGWIRVAPTKQEDGCKDFSLEVVGKPYDGDFAEIHWLSISKEMKLGNEGFAQLGVENTADPGAGGTAKVFVRCFPK